MTLRFLALGLTLIFASGCRAAYHRPCSDDGDCDNLSCRAYTDIPPFCTAECAGDEECRTAFGDASYCATAGVCLVECASHDDCPASTRCRPEHFCARPVES